jgi:hypothetical protein
MADALKIEIQGLTQMQQQLVDLPVKLTKKLDYVLEKGARAIELKANQKKPIDLGGLQVRVDSQFLVKEITVNANYAAFMEFGTGKYAAAYVATLPQEWQQYAAQFKGQIGGGSWADLLLNILAWVKRQGITGHYSVKTQRRLGNANQKAAEDYEAAYLIARSILIKGVHPHPFLYPAFFEVLPSLQKDIQEAIDTFAV